MVVESQTNMDLHEVNNAINVMFVIVSFLIYS